MLLTGKLISRTQGTPQGGVISPLLANIFVHYAFDRWIRQHYPDVAFERYADDIVVHCRTKAQAETLKQAIEERLKNCKLRLNDKKTQLVYCGLYKQKEGYPNRGFTFLGYTFRRRLAYSKTGKQFVGFLPAISKEAKHDICQVIKRWRIHLRTTDTIEGLAE